MWNIKDFAIFKMTCLLQQVILPQWLHLGINCHSWLKNAHQDLQNEILVDMVQLPEQQLCLFFKTQVTSSQNKEHLVSHMHVQIRHGVFFVLYFTCKGSKIMRTKSKPSGLFCRLLICN